MTDASKRAGTRFDCLHPSKRVRGALQEAFSMYAHAWTRDPSAVSSEPL